MDVGAQAVAMNGEQEAEAVTTALGVSQAVGEQPA